METHCKCVELKDDFTPNEPKTFQEHPQYPKLMMVSMEEQSWFKRVVEFEKEVRGKTFYFAWNLAENLEESLEQTKLSVWEYAKEIEQPNVIELTLEEIAEKFGISVDNLKIKK